MSPHTSVICLWLLDKLFALKPKEIWSTSALNGLSICEKGKLYGPLSNYLTILDHNFFLCVALDVYTCNYATKTISAGAALKFPQK